MHKQAGHPTIDILIQCSKKLTESRMVYSTQTNGEYARAGDTFCKTITKNLAYPTHHISEVVLGLTTFDNSVRSCTKRKIEE